MKLTGSVSVLEAAEFGAWRIQARLNDLAMLGKPRARTPGRSIIGLRSCELSSDRKSLTFQIDDALILNLGDTSDCIAVLIESPDSVTASHQIPAAKSAPTSSPVQRLRTGDQAFLNACRSEELPPSIIRLGENFLKAVREFSDDALQEGLHRKWVTYPKNFLAITIQNRNQQFCVHVKQSAVLHELSDRLDIRDDRPGYARFWLQNDSQLSEAIKAAKASFEG